MNSKDRLLGMDRPIDRRDFLNGTSVAIGASLLAACTAKAPSFSEMTEAPVYYPPAKTGMRGSHPGSFESAHLAVQGETWQATPTGEYYDLVIVGGGISGLSSAYIYLRDVDADARILILDNHDDFGGHAKRNEFTVDGNKLIGYGGTMYITEPLTYPDVSRQVMQEIGITKDHDNEYVTDGAYSTLDLDSATFFDKETFGVDHIAKGDLSSANALDGAPLSQSAKEQLSSLLADETDYLAEKTDEERRTILQSHSWRDYLREFAGMGEEVLTFIQRRGHGGWGVGSDIMPAWLANDLGYPGFGDSGEDPANVYSETQDNGRFRYPDGNASVARLLVRKIIPEVAGGNTMEDIVTANFDYSTLDRAENQTRIRLSSMVIGLNHIDGDLNGDVEVSYLNGERAISVTGSKVIWAGYHALLPYVSSEIPENQVEALNASVRSPLVYINVAVRNWRSFVNLGVNRFSCPGSFCTRVGFTHPTSIGGYEFAKTPDDPVILQMQHIPLAPGHPAPDQFRMGRASLLQTSFEEFERNIRDQLGRMLGPGGFDPARDIAGITVNRWPHGYAYSIDPESNDVAYYPDDYWPHERKPWVEARERIGNIAIAGTDAASNAMTESAIEEAHRAVHSFRIKT